MCPPGGGGATVDVAMLIGAAFFLIALAEIVLGLFLVTRYERNQATFWYGLFAIGVAMYVGSNGLGYLRDNLYIAERLGWVGLVAL